MSLDLDRDLVAGREDPARAPLGAAGGDRAEVGDQHRLPVGLHLLGEDAVRPRERLDVGGLGDRREEARPVAPRDAPEQTVRHRLRQPLTGVLAVKKQQVDLAGIEARGAGDEPTAVGEVAARHADDDAVARREGPGHRLNHPERRVREQQWPGGDGGRRPGLREHDRVGHAGELAEVLRRDDGRGGRRRGRERHGGESCQATWAP